MKKLLTILLLVCLLIGAFWWWQTGETVRYVDTVTIKRGVIESRLQLTGKVIDDRTVILTALLDGEVKTIRAREGDTVKAGDVLAELDAREATALLEKANAELSLQQQAVDTAKRNFERTEQLFKVEGVSEQAMADMRDAKLAAEASLNVVKAALKVAKLRLDNARIKSPYDGTVIDQSAETGQWLEAGKALFTVVATEGLVIEAGVSASDWTQLSVGQEAELSLDADSVESWLSEVSWISPSVKMGDSGGKVVFVRFPPGEQAPALLLGQEVDVDLSLQKRNDVLVLQFQLLTEEPMGEYWVYVLDNGQAKRRRVQLGLASLNEAEIVDGLQEGDQVIVVSAGTPLFDGQAVESTP